MPKPIRSIRRRVARGLILALAFVTPPLAAGGVAIRGRQAQQSARVDAPQLPLPLPAPTVPDPSRKLAVVVTGNHGTEITDSLPVIELLGETRGLDVVLVAPERKVSPLVTGLLEDARLDIVPDYSFADFDALGRNPDLVVVPYLTRWEGEDAGAVAWIGAQADDDTTILSICGGGMIAAASGAFDGYAATANDTGLGREDFWAARQAQFPTVRWQRDVRWVRDGRRISSGTLAAGMDAALAAIDALFGRAEAEHVIATTGYPHGRFLDDPAAAPPPVDYGVLLEAAFRWEDEDVGVLITDGVSEAAVAGVIDAHASVLNARTYGIANERRVHRSRHGLSLVPRQARSDRELDRVVDPAVRGTGFAYERGLEEVERTRGVAYARLAADSNNYRRDHLDLGGGWPVGLSLLWRPFGLGLAGVALALLAMRGWRTWWSRRRVLARPAIAATTAVAVLMAPAFAPDANAEPAPAADTAAAAPVVVPPALTAFVEAEYPAQARAAGLTAEVELEITIGVDGAVVDVAVVRPAGNGFDEAAVAAARQFVFTPAQRDGVAMAARIHYRYVFTLTEVATPVVPPAPPVADVEDGAEVDVAVELDDDELAQFGSVARVEAPTTELTTRRVTAEELTRVAGTRGDALRTVELLPGVARPPGGAGMIVVRGAAPWDSEVSFEGAPVRNLYHFGGLTSFVNGDLLESIELYPGNFSVRHGRRTGAIVRADLRDPREGFHYVADVNLIDAAAMVEGRVDDDVTAAIAARRSYVDAWYGGVAGELVEMVAAPVYWDYQGILAWDGGTNDRVRLLTYGSSDALEMIMAEASDDDPSVRGRLGSANTFHRAQVDWSRRWSDRVEHDIQVTGGFSEQSAEMGSELRSDIDALELYARGEIRWHAGDRLRVTGGLDVEHVAADIVYQGPGVTQGEGDGGARPEDIMVTREATWSRPAAYAEATLRPIGTLDVTAGVRTDYFADLGAWTVDPRLQARWITGATTLKGGAGMFSQPPDYAFTLEAQELEPTRALHLGAGIDHAFSRRTSLGIEGFYKDLDQLIVDGASPGRLTNQGYGRVVGLEVAGRLQPGGPVSGFVSYTLSRSQRDDGDGEGWRLFDYDQTHILTASASWRLGAGWTLGGTFRLTSGNPETPVDGSVYDADQDLYIPVYGATNSTRNPAYHRLDVRVEKGFRWIGSDWAAYLDVQNAYNHQNREGTRYNYDYSRRLDVPGLPLLPSIGLKAAL